MQIITQGDRAQIPFTLETAPDVPHVLTGATFETKIMDSGDGVDTFPDASHAIDSAADGEMTLTLTPVETAALKVGTREVLIKVTQSGNPIHYRSYCLTVKPATPEG